jgi:hypothetical protein
MPSSSARRFAGTDEPDALAFADGDAGAVEERVQPERELGVAEGQ